MKHIKRLSTIVLGVCAICLMFSCKSQKQVVNNTPVEEKTPTQLSKPTPISGVPPRVEYVVKGKVSTAKGKVVPGMQVILLHSSIPVDFNQPAETEYTKQLMEPATAITDENGRFECHLMDVHNLSERVFVRDIDGEKNGSYQNVVVEVPFGVEDIVVNEQGQRTGIAVKEIVLIVKNK